MFGLLACLALGCAAAKAPAACDRGGTCPGQLEDESLMQLGKLGVEAGLPSMKSGSSVQMRGRQTAKGEDSSDIIVQVPASYDGSKPLPLVLIIHGFSDNPWSFVEHFGFYQDFINQEQFITVAPGGRFDNNHDRFWSAWGNWCGDCGSLGDVHPLPCDKLCGDGDVDYLLNLMYVMTSKYNVDLGKIYVYGHSNGAAMAYRLACDAADVFAGVVAFEGAPPEDGWKDNYRCNPSRPISLLHIHGTKDTIVPYDGDQGNEPYCSAQQSVELFAGKNQCPNNEFPADAGSATDTGTEETFDLSHLTPGLDTEVFSRGGCSSNTSVELWKVIGETHNPTLTDQYSKDLLTWMRDHSRHASTVRLPAPSCVGAPYNWKSSAWNSCQDYGRLNYCTVDGGYGSAWEDSWGRIQEYSVNGVDALQACCECGGGLQTPQCTDEVAGWTGSGGGSCEQYRAEAWCTATGRYGSGWKQEEWGGFDDYKSHGYSAATACCACGGGRRERPSNLDGVIPE